MFISVLGFKVKKSEEFVVSKETVLNFILEEEAQAWDHKIIILI